MSSPPQGPAVAEVGPVLRESRRIARSSLGVTVCAAAAALLGLGINILVARDFGASAGLDGYLTGAALPLALSGSLMTCLGYVLIPMLARTQRRQELLAQLYAPTLLLVLAGVIAGLLATPLLIQWTAPHLSAAKHALAVAIQRLFWITAGLSSWGSFLAAVHQGDKRFLLPASSVLLIQLSVLAALGLWPHPSLPLLAIAYLVGTAAQAGILLAPLRGSLRVARPSDWAPFASFMTQVAPVLISILPTTLVPMLDAYWATRLPDGSLSYASYDFRLAVAGVSILINGLSAVIFPFLCDHASAGADRRFNRLLLVSLGAELAVAVPAVAGAVAWRQPLIHILFQHGAFTPAITRVVASLLPFYLIGMLGMGVWVIVSRAFYARRDFRITAALGITFVIIYFFLEGWLIPRLGVFAIAASYATCWIMMAVVATVLLQLRALPKPSLQWISPA